MVPAPSGDNSVKTSIVQVEAVGDTAKTVNAEMVLEEVSSEYESDSDDSEGWEALSHDGDTIKLLRDEQLREGLGTCDYASFPDLGSQPYTSRYRSALLYLACANLPF